MSLFRERLVQSSRRDRACAGCGDQETIAKGEPYWSCFYEDRAWGSPPVGYALCVPCRAHLDECSECMHAWRNGDPGGTACCRQETAKA